MKKFEDAGRTLQQLTAKRETRSRNNPFTSPSSAAHFKMPVALQLAQKARSTISPNPVARLYRAIVK